MSKVSEQMIVPFTIKSFLGYLLLLVVLTAPIWWTRLRGSTAAAKTKADLTGEWVGSAHITSYGEGVGRRTPMDQQGTFHLRLEMYDTFLERYRGQGELRLGDQAPRPIQITGLSLNDWSKPQDARAVAGAFRLSANLGGNLEKDASVEDACVIQGSGSSERIQFKTISNDLGYRFDVDLHRGR